MSEFEASGMVSLFDGKPFVEVTLGDTTEKMRPEKAREIARYLFIAASEAERDAATIAFCKGPGGMSNEDAAKYLMMVRDYRKQYEGLE